MSKQDKAVEAIFERPTRADVRWSDFEALIKNKGGTVKPGAGSRKRCELNGYRATIHRPHPGDVMSKAQTDTAREFLGNAGLMPPPPKGRAKRKDQADA